MDELILLYLFPGVFALLGIIFFCVGMGMRICGHRKAETCTQPCMATIVDVKREVSRLSDESHMVSWYPVYEYYACGRIIRKKANIGSAGNNFTIGTQRMLYLNLEKPEEYVCPEEKSRLIQGIFTAIGCILLAAGIAIFIMMRY